MRDQATPGRPATAADVMTPEPVCATGGMTVREVARLLDSIEVSGAPVVDGEGRLIGVVSRSDLLRGFLAGEFGDDQGSLLELFGGDDEGEAFQRGPDPEPLVVVEDFMSPDPVTAPPTATITALAQRMVEARVHRIVIVDAEGLPVGIVTSLDLVQVLAGQAASRNGTK